MERLFLDVCSVDLRGQRWDIELRSGHAEDDRGDAGISKAAWR